MQTLPEEVEVSSDVPVYKVLIEEHLDYRSITIVDVINQDKLHAEEMLAAESVRG